MFLDKKVYVVAWYVTFVILLYGFICFQSLFKDFFLMLIVWIIGVFIFGFVLNKLYYFVSFGVGFFLSKYIVPPNRVEEFNHYYISRILYHTQKYCYSFFLIHAGVLIFLFHILELNIFNSFLIGFLLSMLGAIILNFLTSVFIKKIQFYHDITLQRYL